MSSASELTVVAKAAIRHKNMKMRILSFHMTGKTSDRDKRTPRQNFCDTRPNKRGGSHVRQGRK